MDQGIIVLIVLSLCFALKKAEYVRSKYIPLIALILGVGGGLISLAMGNGDMTMLQAIILGLAPVGLHQVWSRSIIGK